MPEKDSNEFSRKGTSTKKKKIIKYILFIIGGLLLLNAILLPFVSNFHVGFVLEGVISVVVLLYAFFFEKLKKHIHIIMGVLCLIPLIFAAFIAVYGNDDNAGYDEDVVIVLGAGIQGETVSGKLATRLDKTSAYYNKNPKAVIIVCGGRGPQEDIPEALAMERYLIDKGVPKDRILKEDRSTSTYENFSYAKTILDNRFPQGFSSVLITNDYHVYRAVKVANQAGISAKHIGVHTEWYAAPANYLREMLSIIKMWVMPS
jgi:uncharacterized SAM-binding protein YcdF (DUF218 family)